MLTAQHWSTLHALMDRVIPPDDFPGAWDAGVGDYLARQFERDLHPQIEMYSRGLEALDAEAQLAMGKGFTALDAPAQDALLNRVEMGQVMSSWPVDPTGFFHTVIEHVMEGYYSDPDNGGNRDSIAWRMIGFTGRSDDFSRSQERLKPPLQTARNEHE